MLQIILLLGKIREILTSDDKTIQMNDLTSVYLDYIKMIEKKEETNKEAPTEEVKNNVTKIYNKVTSGGMFSSLTNGIRGMFSTRAATSNNALRGNQGMFSSSRAATSNNAAQSVIAGQQDSSSGSAKTAAEHYSRAKKFLHLTMRTFDTFDIEKKRRMYKTAHKIIIHYMTEIMKDRDYPSMSKWLSDNAQYSDF